MDPPELLFGDEGLDQQAFDDQLQEIDNKDGTRDIIEFSNNELGQKIQITTRVRTRQIKFNKKIVDRKKWKKFGDCEGLPPGPDPSTTIQGDEAFIETIRPSKGEDKDKKKKTESDYITSSLLCRTCGAAGDHWTHRCPFKNSDLPKAKDVASSMEPGSKYVIPRHRAGGDSKEDTGRTHRRDEHTLRVTNVSEETTDSDLSDLFRGFGPISRIYVARDRHTQLSKGFAFINFVHKEDAERALAKLNGYGYHHLILHIEWARPSQSS